MNEYKQFSEKKLQEFFKEIFKEGLEKGYKLPKGRKPDEIYTWQDKIKEGYLYRCGTEMSFITGYGGAINFGKQLEEIGCSNEEIEESIAITETEGITTYTVFNPIKYITWHKKN